MNLEINCLCSLCKTLQFDQQSLHACSGSNCSDEQFHDNESKPQSATGLYSTKFRHYNDFTLLQRSARIGCHLCTLLCATLTKFNFYSDYGKHFGQKPVFLRYVKIIYPGNFEFDSEKLRVECDVLRGELPLIDIPQLRCNGREHQSSTLPKQEPEALFISVSTVDSNDIELIQERAEMASLPNESQHPYLEYKGGSLFEVLEHSHSFWLARSLLEPYSKVGWIYGKHQSKLLKPPHPSCNCGQGLWEPVLLKRHEVTYLDPDPASDDVFSQIQSWLKTCIETHPGCHSAQEGRLPFRVIDVGPADGTKIPCLTVGEGRVDRYVTLSYRWGVTSTVVTTTANINEMLAGIPMGILPQTLKDAITVTRKLGLRYLWIDAICILQDSQLDWQEQSALMGQYYAGAFANISADRASDSSDGFLHQRNILEIRSCTHPTLFGNSLDGGKVLCPDIRALEHVEGFTDEGPLHSRGWVLQERLLSRRILHWISNEVRWECNELEASERKPAGCFKHGNVYRGADWTEIRDYIRSGENYLTDTPHSHSGSIGRRMDYSKLALAIFARWKQSIESVPFDAESEIGYTCWYRMVEEYSRRELTKPDDKLSAISGLAAMWRKLENSRSAYIAGLWIKDLLRGLIWFTLLSYSNVPPGHHSILKGLQSYRAPSFSWASVDTEVRFIDATYISPFDPIPKYDVEILGLQNSPSGPDHLGQISSGWIRLRGLAILYSNLPNVKRSAVDTEHRPPGVTYWDQEEMANDWDSVVSKCLVFSMRIRKEPDRLFLHGVQFCLLLLPTKNREGEYYRVGAYEEDCFRGNLKGWKKTVVTII